MRSQLDKKNLDELVNVIEATDTLYFRQGDRGMLEMNLCTWYSNLCDNHKERDNKHKYLIAFNTLPTLCDKIRDRGFIVKLRSDLNLPRTLSPYRVSAESRKEYQNCGLAIKVFEKES